MSESRQKPYGWSMPEDEKLYYKGLGKTNIVDWETNFIIYQKAKHGKYADIFISGEYPKNSIQPWESPEDSRDLEGEDLRRYEFKRKDYIDKYDKGQNVLAQQAAEVKLSMTKSSIDHIEKFNKKEFRDFILNNQPIELYKLASKTHTFIGKESGYDDQQEFRAEFCTFTMNEEELNNKLEVNFNRMIDLIRKCETVDILKELDGKRQCHQQLMAIVDYKPKSAVNDLVVNTLARVNSPNFPRVLPELQRRLLELDDAVTRLSQGN